MNILAPAVPELDGFIRIRAACKTSGLTKATIYRLIKEKKFPPVVKLTRHASGIRESELRRWLADPAGWSEQV